MVIINCLNKIKPWIPTIRKAALASTNEASGQLIYPCHLRVLLIILDKVIGEICFPVLIALHSRLSRSAH